MSLRLPASALLTHHQLPNGWLACQQFWHAIIDSVSMRSLCLYELCRFDLTWYWLILLSDHSNVGSCHQYDVVTVQPPQNSPRLLPSSAGFHQCSWRYHYEHQFQPGCPKGKKGQLINPETIDINSVFRRRKWTIQNPHCLNKNEYIKFTTLKRF